MAASEVTTTVTFWYQVPGFDGVWCKSEFSSPDARRATEVQQRHWDYLNSLGYYLSARP